MSETIKFRIDIESNGEKILKTLNISVDDFNDLIATAVDQTKKMKTSVEKLAQNSIIFNSVNTAIEQLQNLLGGLIEDYNAFDKSMRAVNTMAGENKKGLDALTDQVEDLANAIPLAKTELANGLYQVISNGVPKDNWISFLEASAKSAVGGIADLGQTVTVTSTIIKNYGLEWDAAASIQDKIQMTAKNGVTSFEQLGQALPRVTGNAATLGVSIDELMATFATLTGVSGNTAEVSTQLAAVFTALVKPSSEAAEMASQMGLKFDAAAIKASGGMLQFLQTLTSTVEEYAATHGMLEQEIYGRLFGSAEALRALIPITGELSDTFSMNVEAMAGSAGTIDQAFEDMAGALEILSQANLKGSEAGTALRNIILKLNTELGIDLGETSLSKALEDLQPKLSDATYLSKVFGMENIAAAQFLIQNAEAVDEMTAQLTDTNVAHEQAAKIKTAS